MERVKRTNVSPGSLTFFGDLVTSRALPAEGTWRKALDVLISDLRDAEGRTLTETKARELQGRVSRCIDWLKELPRREGAEEIRFSPATRVPAAQPGVYRKCPVCLGKGVCPECGGDPAGGQVWVVRVSKRQPGEPENAPKRVYAMKIVELRDTQGDRQAESGGKIRFEAEYVKGFVYRLTDADRMPGAEAADLCRRYGHCIQCGRVLKLDKSLERGMGPVCWPRVMGTAAKIAVV